jgi:hypothetical protein
VRWSKKLRRTFFIALRITHHRITHHRITHHRIIPSYGTRTSALLR